MKRSFIVKPLIVKREVLCYPQPNLMPEANLCCCLVQSARRDSRKGGMYYIHLVPLHDGPNLLLPVAAVPDKTC